MPSRVTIYSVPCPTCRKFSEIPTKWHANTTTVCPHCGEIQLVMNAVRLSLYYQAKAQGLLVGVDPPNPLPIEPVRIVPNADGKTETVFKRGNRGGERAHVRKARAAPKA